MIELNLLPNQTKVYGVYRRIGEHQTEMIAKAVIGENTAPDRIEIDASMDGGYISADELLLIKTEMDRERIRQRQPKRKTAKHDH